ncbi:MAG: sigma-70 family RNA polymerase sigma factor [Verrucomicrobiota bacterium]
MTSPADHNHIQEYLTLDNLESLEHLIDRYTPLVRRVAGCVLSDAHEVEDVLQTVFLRLQRKAPQLNQYKNLAPWIYHISRQEALDRLRSRQRRETRIQKYGEARAIDQIEPLSPDRALVRQEIADLLDGCLNRLDKEKRELLIQHYWMGSSVREIAEQTQCRPDTVSMRLNRARKQLKRQILLAGLGASTLRSFANEIQADLETFDSAWADVLNESAQTIVENGVLTTFWSRQLLQLGRPAVLTLAIIGAVSVAAFVFSSGDAMTVVESVVEPVAAMDRSVDVEIAKEQQFSTASLIDQLAEYMTTNRHRLNNTNAAFIPFLERLDEAIQSHKINGLYTSGGEHLLHIAVNYDIPEIGHYLLLMGTDPDVLDSRDRTPLICAAGLRQGGPRMLRDMLCYLGADVNHRSKDLETPISVAAAKGQNDTIEFLAWLGSELYPRDLPYEKMPSVRALANGHEDTYELLHRYENAPPPSLHDSPEIIPEHIQRAFAEAARMGDFEKLDALLSAGADINGRVNGKTTPLLRAASALQHEVVTYLIFLGADVNLAHPNGRTPFMATNGWLGFEPDWMRSMILLAGANMRDRSKNGHTALSHAASHNNPHSVQWAILYGADPDQESKHGTPMHIASKNSAQRIVDVLQWNGVIEEPFHSSDANWQLLNAVKKGDEETIRQIVESGKASIEQTGDNGWSTIVSAVHLRRINSARLLVKLGADLDYQDQEGSTALFATCAWNYYAVNKFRQELIAAGADVNLATTKGVTPLIRASMHGGHYPGDAIDQLLAGGADPYLADQQGRTALDWAERSGRKEAAQRLRQAMTK